MDSVIEVCKEQVTGWYDSIVNPPFKNKPRLEGIPPDSNNFNPRLLAQKGKSVSFS